MGKYVGIQIRSLRTRKGWSQAKLARTLKLKNAQVVSSIEAGKIDMPVARVAGFASALGLPRRKLVLWMTAEYKQGLMRAVGARAEREPSRAGVSRD